MTLLDCILWDSNGYPGVGYPGGLREHTSGIVEINYCDTRNGNHPDWGGKVGMLNSDPSFVNAGTGDYRLNSGSPCLDTGTNTGAPAEDIRGVTRPVSGTCDMGAYEGPYVQATGGTLFKIK